MLPGLNQTMIIFAESFRKSRRKEVFLSPALLLGLGQVQAEYNNQTKIWLFPLQRKRVLGLPRVFDSAALFFIIIFLIYLIYKH